MQRLVIMRDGEVINAVEVIGEVMTIGRDSDADVTLDDSSISRRHATLSQVNAQFFIEDLGSTNGTYLNRKRISIHVLKAGDLIQVGHFSIRFEREQEQPDSQDPDRTMILKPRENLLKRTVPTPERDKAEAAKREKKEKQAAAASVPPKSAVLHFTSAPYTGQEKRIEGSLYTIGKPGGDVAVIARRPQGFFLLHIGGNSYPKINGEAITSTRGVLLYEGDQLEVGDIHAEIRFEAE